MHSSIYIFNIFFVRLPTPKANNVTAAQRNYKKKIKKKKKQRKGLGDKAKSNSRNSNTNTRSQKPSISHIQRSFNIFIIHQAIKANSISPPYHSLAFFYSFSRWFFYFVWCSSFLGGIFIFPSIFLLLYFTFSILCISLCQKVFSYYYKHNGGKTWLYVCVYQYQCIEYNENKNQQILFSLFFLHSFFEQFSTLFSTISHFFSVFSFPFLSIFIFKFVYRLLFGVIVAVVVVAAAAALFVKSLFCVH